MSRTVKQKGRFTRRDFLGISACTLGAVGVGSFVWPFIDQMNPSRDVLATANSTIDLSQIQEGALRVEKWRSKPLFVLHRDKDMIRAAENTELSAMIDPEEDVRRVIKKEWLVVVGICTHLGCVPNFVNGEGSKKEWFCPCHGSRYDLSGRVVKGPAGKNLVVPPYHFKDDKTLLVGENKKVDEIEDKTKESEEA